MKVTVETITDAQIARLIDLGNEILRHAHTALEYRGVTSRKGQRARAECARILNARSAK